ncbi:MAG: YfhO family protein [Bacteroidota bacterium]|nr:YfhO family protein [Candidatus Kapabacteria bacterium]MDW8221145.1 YfhO family protein [Bacteroidota bacterium]
MAMAQSRKRRRNSFIQPHKLYSLPSWLVLLIFVATTLAFFHSQVLGRTYFWEDFAEYIYPIRVFAARYIHAGELPFWNPYTFAGTPFLADVAVGFFYPPNVLLALGVHNGVISVWVVQISIIAHILLAQYTMFLFVRSLGVSSVGALISALSYGFSSYIVCHVFHPMIVQHCAWFPLVWMLLRRALLAAGSARKCLYYALWAGIVLGVMMLSGHPQTTLYLVILLILYAVWVWVVQLKSGVSFRGSWLTLIPTATLLAMLVGAGVFAVQLLHSQEFAAYSERTAFTLEQAAVGGLQIQQLLTLIIPKLFGYTASPQSPEPVVVPFYLSGGSNFYYWETAMYVGVPTLILASIGFARLIHRHEYENIAGMLACVSVFAVLFALGTNGFIFEYMFQLPLFNRFRIPSRMLVYLVLGLTVMAGLGFDEIVRHRVAIRKVLVVASSSVIVCTLTLMVAIPSEAPVMAHGTIREYAGVAFLLAGVTFVLLWLILEGSGSFANACATAIPILVFVDLYAVGKNFNQSMLNPAEQYMRADAAIPSAMRAHMMNPDSLYRVSMRAQGVMLMPRNQGLYTPIMLYEGYMPLLIGRRLPAAPTSEQTLDLLNVRYAVAVDSAEGRAYFQERTTAFPRARMLYDAVQTTPEQAETVARAGAIQFSTQVLVEQPIPLPLPQKAPEYVLHRVRCTRYTANQIEYEIETAENGMLVLSEIWYPAWKATIDGQPTDILRVNYSLRGIVIPKGKHVLVMAYRSSAFQVGAWISLVTVISSMIAIGMLRRSIG